MPYVYRFRGERSLLSLFAFLKIRELEIRKSTSLMYI